MDWVIGILLDLVLLGIVLLFFRQGKKDGFAKTIVSFLSFFIALVIAGMLCTPITNVGYSKAIETPAESAVESALRSQIGQANTTLSDGSALFDALEKSGEKLPGFVRRKLALSERREELTAQLRELYSADVKTMSARVTESVIRPAAVAVLRVIAFVVLFILISILCAFVARALKFVNKIPLLGGANALLGGLLGIVKGLIVVLILGWVIGLMCQNGGQLFGVITAQSVERSLILRFLAAHNPISLSL